MPVQVRARGPPKPVILSWGVWLERLCPVRFRLIGRRVNDASEKSLGRPRIPYASIVSCFYKSCAHGAGCEARLGSTQRPWDLTAFETEGVEAVASKALFGCANPHSAPTRYAAETWSEDGRQGAPLNDSSRFK